jgi:hypothetical protein
LVAYGGFRKVNGIVIFFGGKRWDSQRGRRSRRRENGDIETIAVIPGRAKREPGI